MNKVLCTWAIEYTGHNIHMAIKYNTQGMKTCFVFGNEWNVDFQWTMKEKT